MTTIHDVAKKANVSISTVSNVLNNSGKFSETTRVRVLDAVNELNYIPNQIGRSLKTKHTNCIGILCEELSFSASAQIIAGINQYTENTNYSIIFANLGFFQKMGDYKNDYDYVVQQQSFRDSLDKNIKLFLTARVSGIIYISVHSRNLDGIMPDVNVPVIYLHGYTNSGENCVNYDDFKAAEQTTDYLIQQGHTKIGLISGPVNSIPSHKRLLGYQTAIMNHSLTYNPDYIKISDWSYDGGYHACKTLLELSYPPTAVFAMSDYMAYGALKYALKHQIQIPDQLSMVGFDNYEFSEFTIPQLTSVKVPLLEMGEYAAKSLIELIEKTDVCNKTKLFECSLVHRNSVAKINLK